MSDHTFNWYQRKTHLLLSPSLPRFSHLHLSLPPLLLPRDYQGGDVTPEGADGGSQPDPTPQQLHRQYLGDSRPELPPFPEIQWAGTPIPGMWWLRGLQLLISHHARHSMDMDRWMVHVQICTITSLSYEMWVGFFGRYAWNNLLETGACQPYCSPHIILSSLIEQQFCWNAQLSVVHIT